MPQGKTLISSAANGPPFGRSQVLSIRRSLLTWYRRCGRDLPWRRMEDSPYAQWLAEMMLQQTRAETVIPYFERFLVRFPNLESLARADLDDVLSLWSGLGYYARARNLHKAAGIIMGEHKGRVPDTMPGLLALPGVGRYTAGAIGSIAYGLPAPVLDGNVIRVLSRLCLVNQDPSRPDVRECLWRWAEALLPRTGCGDFNQGLMELGAVICTPRSPRCDECPLRRTCRARAMGVQESLPAKSGKTPSTDLAIVSLVIVCANHVLLRRRPAVGLWAGLWEPPGIERNGRPVARRIAARILPGSWYSRIKRYRRVGTSIHQLTHRRVAFEAFLGRLIGRPPSVTRAEHGPRHRWVRFDHLPEIGISQAHRSVLRFGVQ